MLPLIAMTALRASPLTDKIAEDYAQLALANLEREYPNKLGNVLTGPDSLKSPRALHPAFYGSFDWHSSVHGHWMLIALLSDHPDINSADQIEALLNRQLTPENMAAEAAYWDAKENASFERMYGWAWALQLARELYEWKAASPDDPRPAQWLAAFHPLEARIVELTTDYLPRLTYPIRVGTHTDTAFALGMIHDYAVTTGNADLASLIARRATVYYFKDRDYPVAYEPSGHDFFSPGLNEADLMRRVLNPEAYGAWLEGFFPDLAKAQLGTLLDPVAVSDPTDGHLIHLAGLNFCRAWTMAGIAKALPDTDPRAQILQKSATEHLSAGLPFLNSGHYEGDHWLASFAVYAMRAQPQRD